jgi:hypothetical protein
MTKSQLVCIMQTSWLPKEISFRATLLHVDDRYTHSRGPQYLVEATTRFPLCKQWRLAGTGSEKQQTLRINSFIYLKAPMSLCRTYRIKQ